MNLDIFANIKIVNDTRLKYALASIESLLFLKDEVKFYFNLDDSNKYLERIKEALQLFDYELSDQHKYFNEIYQSFISKSKKDFFMCFEEDHFCVLDDIKFLEHIINIINLRNPVEIIKITFFNYEKMFYKNAPIFYEDIFCKIINHTEAHYETLNKKCIRFYIGNNCIFEKQFGKKYFNERIKNKYDPHAFEIKRYDQEFQHNLMIPKREILCAIDDDHGAKDSCLLNRNEPKWEKIYGKFK